MTFFTLIRNKTDVNKLIHRKFLSLYLFIFALLTVSTSSAQSDSSSTPQFYKPSEIPLQLDNTSSFLVREKNSIVSTSMIKDANKMLQQLKENFNKLNTVSDSSKLAQFNSVQLKNINRRWEVLQHQMGQSLKAISERTSLLETKVKKLKNISDTWDLTLKNDSQNLIPNDLRKSILLLKGEIKNLLHIVQKESNELLSIQSGFSNKNMTIETKRLLLKELIATKQRAAFERNSYPLWEGFSDTTSSNSISSQINDLLFTYKSAVKNFYDFYESKIPLGIIIFFLFLGFTYLLKFYSDKIEDDTPTVHKALQLLKNPFALSLLLFLFFISLTTEAATTFNGLRKIIMLVMLLIILIKIIDPKLKSGLFFFMILFVLKELKVNTGSDTLIERLSLLGLTLFSYIAIYWIYKANHNLNLFTDKRLIHLINLGIKISLVLLSLVLILNILGYIMLANILINGFYNSIYATILILTADLIFNAILLLLLKTGPMQKLKIVTLHSDSIITIFARTMKITLSILWIIITLSSFQIYDFIHEGIVFLLITDIGYGALSISLGNIILFFLTIWVSFLLARFIHFILEVDVLPQFRLSRGVPGAILSLSRYTIITFGILAALMSIGIDFNKFAIIIGALGVGIGFGLQNLVNNFISGIILIFERPIQVGDVIRVQELTGTVKKIGLRASIVRTFEGADIIVPNGNLIAGELTNWTFSDQQRRINIAVGVKYGCDAEKVKEILLNIAAEDSKVLNYPAPYVLFSNFGDSALEFVLRCWTADFDHRLETESNLRFKIKTAFEENDITIPFPQTDINFKNELQINTPKQNDNDAEK